MIRKITLIIILLLLLGSCLLIILGTQQFITDHFETINELKQSSDAVKSDYSELEKIATVDMQSKKKILSSAIEEYEKTKAEYDSIVAQTSNFGSSETEAGKDIYDVGFLWTIVGNYATEEGVNLKLDISRNTTSPLSYNNSNSDDFVVCDFKFSVTGPYINLTDFIYDIEDDDRLNFEINNFIMEQNLENPSDKEPLKAEFIVFALKLQKSTLIESYVSNGDVNSTNNNDDINTVNNPNTANITNTSNTSSGNVIKSSNNIIDTIN